MVTVLMNAAGGGQSLTALDVTGTISHPSQSTRSSTVSTISSRYTTAVMAFLLTRPSAILGLGLGTSLCLNPLSPFRAPPMQCQYTAPYYRPEAQTTAETGWEIPANDPALNKQGKTSTTSGGGGLLTARNMRQASMGSVLGLVAGVGLRAFSRALVVLIGMGIVLVEVRLPAGSLCGGDGWLLINVASIVGCVEGV